MKRRGGGRVEGGGRGGTGAAARRQKINQKPDLHTTRACCNILVVL
jgi:hypothetical protein